MPATTPTDTPNSFTLFEQFHKDGVEGDVVLDEDDAATIQGSNAAPPPSYTRITFRTPMDKLAKDKPKATLLKAKEIIDCLQEALEEVDIHTNILDSLPIFCATCHLKFEMRKAFSFLRASLFKNHSHPFPFAQSIELLQIKIKNANLLCMQEGGE